MTTNSVSQGEHVGLMFPMIFAKGIEIGFAYTSFKWENNAKRNAGVTVAVIGLRNAVDRAEVHLHRRPSDRCDQHQRLPRRWRRRR